MGQSAGAHLLAMALIRRATGSRSEVSQSLPKPVAAIRSLEAEAAEALGQAGIRWKPKAGPRAQGPVSGVSPQLLL